MIGQTYRPGFLPPNTQLCRCDHAKSSHQRYSPQRAPVTYRQCQDCGCQGYEAKS
jgi:hypothetical protein